MAKLDPACYRIRASCELLTSRREGGQGQEGGTEAIRRLTRQGATRVAADAATGTTDKQEKTNKLAPRDAQQREGEREGEESAETKGEREWEELTDSDLRERT